jgi:localization factor PodJL
VIADPGEKPNFIAAARRAAQAAASAPPHYQPDAEAAERSSASPKKQRVRTLIVAGAAALIVVGCIHIASRLFEDGGLGSAPEAQQEKAAPPAAALPEPEPPTPLSPEPTPLPVPSTPPSAAPSPPPSAKSGAIIVAKPVRQSALHDSAQQPVPVAAAPAADITGSLPRPAAVQSTATGPANAPFGDKLPATIGGPALRAAALSGDASAAYEVAMRFAEGHGVAPSNQEAAVWLERAAKQGLVPAQFRLGSLYEKGVGVKKNLAAARDLYLAAADKGNGKAMHNLAVLYAEGIDGPADYVNAAHWFRLAADHGVTDSQYNLAILYARGIGVAQNFAESYKWFALAANQGDDDAAKKRDEVATHLDQQSLAAARLAVQTWTAEPQPDEAITVKTPAGGWDTTANGTPAAKLNPRPPGVKTPAPDAKIN